MTVAIQNSVVFNICAENRQNVKIIYDIKYNSGTVLQFRGKGLDVRKSLQRQRMK